MQMMIMLVNSNFALKKTVNKAIIIEIKKKFAWYNKA